jgi:hypothetical protein
MRDVDIAWFAGIFEGEGCFSIEKNGNTNLTVNMTDLDVIQKIKTLFPKYHNVKPIQPRPAKGYTNQPKVRYTWRVGDPVEVAKITEMILPWLGERRSERAREVLNHLAIRPGIGGYQRAKTHCPQDHEYTVENTIYKGGKKRYRRCRTCAKVSWTAANAKKPRREPQPATAACNICGKDFEYMLGGTAGARRRTLCSDGCRLESQRRAARECQRRIRALARSALA